MADSLANFAKRRSGIDHTGFVTLYEEGDWLIGYYDVKDMDGHYFLQIYNTRSSRKYDVNDLVPAHIKSKYIFWKNMLTE